MLHRERQGEDVVARRGASLRSHGNSAVRSISAARGATRSSARTRTASRRQALLLGEAVRRGVGRGRHRDHRIPSRSGVGRTACDAVADGGPVRSGPVGGATHLGRTLSRVSRAPTVDPRRLGGRMMDATSGLLLMIVAAAVGIVATHRDPARGSGCRSSRGRREPVRGQHRGDEALPGMRDGQSRDRRDLLELREARCPADRRDRAQTHRQPSVLGRGRRARAARTSLMSIASRRAGAVDGGRGRRSASPCRTGRPSRRSRRPVSSTWRVRSALIRVPRSPPSTSGRRRRRSRRCCLPDFSISVTLDAGRAEDVARRGDDAVVAGEVARVVDGDAPRAMVAGRRVGVLRHRRQPARRHAAPRGTSSGGRPGSRRRAGRTRCRCVLKQCGQAVTIVRSPIP